MLRKQGRTPLRNNGAIQNEAEKYKVPKVQLQGVIRQFKRCIVLDAVYRAEIIAYDIEFQERLIVI
jgi:hypothetical protein